MDPEHVIEAQIEAIASKRSFMKDRMKKRRQALEDIISHNSKPSSTHNSSSSVNDRMSHAEKRIKSSISLTESSKISDDMESDDKNKSLNDDIQSLLSTKSAKQKELEEQHQKVMELISKPTARERFLMEAFKSQEGSNSVRLFCNYSTRLACDKNCEVNNAEKGSCKKMHFMKIIKPHTDESLGDCSFLNACFHIKSCKFVHYMVDSEDSKRFDEMPTSRESNITSSISSSLSMSASPFSSSKNMLANGGMRHTLIKPQWVQCDVRSLDLSFLGKFSVIMADPPWDIHMELPYGTMSDDEMRRLPIPSLQDNGLLFLWVTGRAMELGRECLRLWGYERIDELIWVKTNQLQRLIRTGRTGHWFNHAKEHCLIGRKGEFQVNKFLDCDVIVAEVRATSHKPDEVYGLIERMCPGTRKIELFGRPHNIQPNWVTLGNQVDGIVLHEPHVLQKFKKLYPYGYEMMPGHVVNLNTNPSTGHY